MKPIITSLLDTDLYKFKMSEFISKTDFNTCVKYKFINRSNINLDVIPKDELQYQISEFKKLFFKYDELSYLESIGFSVEYLNKIIRLHENVNIFFTSDNNKKLEFIIEGPWMFATLYEIPLLAIVNELYTMKIDDKLKDLTALKSTVDSAIEKRNILKEYKDIKFIDFGTRRRCSKTAQETILMAFLQNNNLIGTSNVYFAKKLGLKPYGTIAHEIPMFYATLTFMNNSHLDIDEKRLLMKEYQQKAINDWIKYSNDPVFWLTDTYGTKNWLDNFSHIPLKNKNFGLRQDSGDPLKFIDTLFDYYDIKDIPPLIFSDNLNIYSMIKIYDYAKNKGIDKITFGWGTNLTNDGIIKPLNIVIKLDGVLFDRWIPAVKLSDNINKATGRNIEEYKQIFNYTN